MIGELVKFALIMARVKAKPDQQANKKKGRVLPRISGVVITWFARCNYYVDVRMLLPLSWLIDSCSSMSSSAAMLEPLLSL